MLPINEFRVSSTFQKMSKTETFLYFAFGSNLLKERLQLRNPSAVYKAVAKLEKYELTFWGIKDPKRWPGGAANIEKADNCCIWGTVWELCLQDMASLDLQESGYAAIEVDVTTPGGKKLTCRTYQIQTGGKPCQYDTRPCPQYLDVIVKGAVQSNLPQDYIDKLTAVEHNGFSGKVQIYEEILELLGKSGNDG